MAKRWARIAEESGARRRRERTALPALARPPPQAIGSALLALAYPDRIAKNRGGGPAVSCSRTGAAAMSIRPRRWRASLSSPWPSSPARRRRAASCWRRRSRSPRSKRALPRRSRIATQSTFDAASASLRARRTRRLGAIVLAEQIKPVTPDSETAKQLARRHRTLGIGKLPWSKAQLQLRNRVSFLRKSEGDEWPDLSDDALARERRRLAGAVPGRQDRARSRSAPTILALRSMRCSLEPAQAARRRGADAFHSADRLGGADRLRGRAGPEPSRSAYRNCSASPRIRALPAGACRW